eukprot:SAG31_NODE_192_length_20788_cov_8.938083_9_plen_324_part_00
MNVAEPPPSVPQAADNGVQQGLQALRPGNIRLLYMQKLETHAFLTQSLSAGVLYMIGDSMAQGIEFTLQITSPGKDKYNWLRTLRMGAFGLLIAGPMLTCWYQTLHLATKAYRYVYEPVTGVRAMLYNVRVPGASSTRTVYEGKCLVEEHGPWRDVLAKVFADNMLFNPLFLTVYFAGMGVLEQKSWYEIVKKTKENFHSTWAIGLLLWVPVQIVNFRWISRQHQVLFVTLIATLWKTFLSFIFHNRDYGNIQVAATTAKDQQAVVTERLVATNENSEAELATALAEIDTLRKLVAEHELVIAQRDDEIKRLHVQLKRSLDSR